MGMVFPGEPRSRFLQRPGQGVMKMKKSRGMFGTLCLLVSIVVIYGLLGYRGYILYTEGIWLDWTVGNSVPDPMVWAVVSMRPSVAKTVAIWLLSQDILLYLLPFPIILALLDRRVSEKGAGE
jgi:hypothetical protein